MSPSPFEKLTTLGHMGLPHLQELNGNQIAEVGFPLFDWIKQEVSMSVAVAHKNGNIYQCNVSAMPVEWRVTVLAKILATQQQMKTYIQRALLHAKPDITPEQAVRECISVLLKQHSNDALRKNLPTDTIQSRAYIFISQSLQKLEYAEDPKFFCAFNDWQKLPVKSIDKSAASANEPPTKRPKLSLTVGGKGGDYPPLVNMAIAAWQEIETLKAEKAEKQRAIEELQAENQRMKQKMDEQVVQSSQLQQFLDNVIQQGMQFSSKKNTQSEGAAQSTAPPAAP